MFADELKTKSIWFEPLFAARPDRPLESAMMREWKEYMSYEDDHPCGWVSRMAGLILSPIPGGLNTRTARVATTFALWCVTNNGRGFLDPVLRKIRATRNESAEDIAIGAWAVENQLELPVKNRLEAILSGRDGKFYFQNHPYPRLSDNRAVEQTLKFLVGEEGRDLLKRVCQSTTGNWLPL